MDTIHSQQQLTKKEYIHFYFNAYIDIYLYAHFTTLYKSFFFKKID